MMMTNLICLTAIQFMSIQVPDVLEVADVQPSEPVVQVAQADTPKKEKKAEPKKKAEPTDDASAIAAKVQKKYEKVTDLSAKFTQQISVQGGARKGPTTTGTLYLKKPGKLRWEFDEAMTFISDGKTLWQYDPDENQVIVNKFMQQTTSVTALNFLSGMGELTQAFNVSKVEPRGEKKDRGLFIKLVPKDEEDVQLTELTLVIDPRTWLATEAYLTDPLGNETHLIFEDVKVNTGLKEARFNFQIPEGAEVIEPSLLMRQ